MIDLKFLTAKSKTRSVSEERVKSSFQEEFGSVSFC